MPAYLVATVRITDPAQFALYAKAVAGLAERYGGEMIVRGPVTEVLEGDATPGERVVVTRFADAEAVRAYVGSSDYRLAKQLREGAATVTIRLLAD